LPAKSVTAPDSNATVETKEEHSPRATIKQNLGNNNGIYAISSSNETTISNSFTFGDDAEDPVVFKFVYREENGVGSTAISVGVTEVETCPGNMTDLATTPILYTHVYKDKVMNLEYGVGVDNPGFYLMCNGEHHKNMPSGPDAVDRLLERGAMTSDFTGKLKWTRFEVFFGLEHKRLLIEAQYNTKNKVLQLKEGKNVELVRGKKLNDKTNYPMPMTLQP